GLTEFKRLQARCHYAPIPILVNGQDMRSMLTPPAWASCQFKGPTSHGRIWFPTQAAEAGSLTFVKNGILLARPPMQQAVPPCSGVVHARLLANLSYTAFVEDDHWRQTLRELAAAHDQLLLELIDTSERIVEPDPAILELLRSALTARWHNISNTLIGQPLLRLPLFPTRNGKPASAMELLESLQTHGSLLTHPDPVSIVPRQERPVLDSLNPHLSALFGSQLKPYEREAGRYQMRQANMQQFEEHLFDDWLQAEDYAVMLEREERGWKLQVGLCHRKQTTRASRYVVKQGHLLVKHELAWLPAGTDLVLSHHNLTPRFTWDDVQDTPLWHEGTHAVLKLFEQALDVLVDQRPEHPEARRVVQQYLSRNHRPPSLAVRGFPLFELINGERASFAELELDARTFGRIRYSIGVPPGPQQTARPIVMGDVSFGTGAVRDLLLHCFAEYGTQDYSQELLRERQVPGAQDDVLPESALAVTRFRRGHIQGAIGLGDAPPELRNVCHVRLFNGR
ncbi:MAG: hypothetical protein ACYCW6_19910, partial [Candidatus Xenobia bacterium]